MHTNPGPATTLERGSKLLMLGTADQRQAFAEKVRIAPQEGRMERSWAAFSIPPGPCDPADHYMLPAGVSSAAGSAADRREALLRPPRAAPDRQDDVRSAAWPAASPPKDVTPRSIGPTPGGVQREVLELKVWRDGRADPLAHGLEQLEGYLETLDLDHGALLVFDRRSNAGDLADRSEMSELDQGGRSIRLLRL